MTRRKKRRSVPFRIKLPGWRMIAIGTLMSLPYLAMIATTSLPIALAPIAPSLAARFGDPSARLLIATQQRDRLFADYASAAGLSPSSTKQDAASQPIDRSQVRTEIRSSMLRLLKHEPLNARAHQLLAETFDDAALVERHMSIAAALSRREPVPNVWMMNAGQVAGDHARVLNHADSLLRTKPELAELAVSFLVDLAATDAGRSLLVDRLKGAPPWRSLLFSLWPRLMKEHSSLLTVFLDLQDSPRPPTSTEIGPYLRQLLARKQVEEAYGAWLRLLPSDRLTELGFLTNGDFKSQPSGLPFDWQIGNGQNAVAELSSDPRAPNGNSLRLTYGTGRVRQPEISQIVVLPAGQYRLRGQLVAELRAKRGLKWEIRCVERPDLTVATGQQLPLSTKGWTEFSLVFNVPATDCRGLSVALRHDARSASEEFIEGTAAFAALSIDRVE